MEGKGDAKGRNAMGSRSIKEDGNKEVATE
jgi:hypothetical protein